MHRDTHNRFHSFSKSLSQNVSTPSQYIMLQHSDYEQRVTDEWLVSSSSTPQQILQQRPPTEVARQSSGLGSGLVTRWSRLRFSTAAACTGMGDHQGQTI